MVHVVVYNHGNQINNNGDYDINFLIYNHGNQINNNGDYDINFVKPLL
jgi:hypothetical protein